MYQGEARNSIVFYNLVGAVSTNLSSVGTVLFSCTPDSQNGVLGNITNAPQFISISNGNYRLAETSLCIDAGINAYAQTSVDLDGNSRIVNSRIDMGAYELQVGAADSDNDGLSDAEEIRRGTNPSDPDSDNDGFKDGWEVSHGWNPNHADFAVSDYIGSNPAVFGYYTSESIGDLAMGEMMVGVNSSNINIRLQMMKSSDLITWTNAGSSVEWAVPATGKEFFRILAEP